MFSTEIESFGGPFFVIVWISFILYGLGLAQVYFYLTTYRDHYAMRLVVILLCVLETVQVGTCMHFLYADLVADFSNPENLLTVLWSEIAAMSLELIINGLVQSYYIYRIWRLSHNIPMVVYLSVVLGCRTATGFRASSFAYPYNDWLVLGVLKPYKRFAAATLSLSVLLDSSITFILWLYLRHAHSLACKRSTRNTVHKLMYYALSAGGLTTMASVVTLCVFTMAASPVLFGGLAMIMAKLYANSMLAMLNIRQGLRDTAVVEDEYSIRLSALRTHASPIRSAPRVHITRETISTADSDMKAALSNPEKTGEPYPISLSS